MRTSFILAPLAAVVLLLAGCDQTKLVSKLTPVGEDTMARSLIEDLRAGRLFDAELMIDQRMPAAKVMPGLEQLQRLFRGGSELSMEEIGFHEHFYFNHGHTVRTTNLTYEIHLTTGWFVGTVVLIEKGNSRTVGGVHFNAIPTSLETMNRFTLAGKSPRALAYLVAAAVMPLLVLAVFVLCLRSRIRRKWLWAIFVALGFGTVTLNWTTGATSIHAISVLLFGASAFQMGPYSPWMISISFPLGAIVFLAARGRLVRQAAGQS